MAFSRRAGILSGPDALLGLSFCMRLLTPDLVTWIEWISGVWLCLRFEVLVVFSVVNTEEN